MVLGRSVLRRVAAVGKKAEVHQLARQVGQEIFAADDLAEALGIVETVKPDLVLVDRRFRPSCIRKSLDTAPKNSDIHIVVVGRNEDNNDVSAEFIRMGAYDYVEGKQDQRHLEHIAN